jgi:hypothetical protein
VLIYDLPVAFEDPEEQADPPDGILQYEFSRTQRLPAPRSDVPLDVVQRLCWTSGE